MILSIDSSSSINNDWLDNFIPWLGKSAKLPTKGFCWLNPFLSQSGTRITYLPEKGLILVRALKYHFIPAQPFMKGSDLKVIYKAAGIATIDFSTAKRHINVYSGRWFDKANVLSLDDETLYGNSSNTSPSVIK